jgi:oligopeptide transport system permease protein
MAVAGALAFAAPIFGPDPAAQDLSCSLEPPSIGHIFGTDLAGRDLFARVLSGTRISLAIGLAATLVSVLFGVAVGSVAGYGGPRLDALLMRAVDVLYGLPYLVFVVVLGLVFGRGLLNLFFAIGAVSWLSTARIVRQEIHSLRRREFVEAARALGAGRARIFFRHLFPNVFGTLAVAAALSVPQAVRQEALLSFLGLGVEPPAASLGSLLRDGLGALTPGRFEWWLLVFPLAALIAIVAAMNALADAIRDRLDPRRLER